MEGRTEKIQPRGEVREYTHPLVNEESSHYAMVDGLQTIERFEQMYTKEELMAWAKISAMKYRMRIGRKDDPSKEVKKIKTYEDYYTYLSEL